MPVYYSTGLIAGDGAILQAPTADGSAGQLVSTDGSGQLLFNPTYALVNTDTQYIDGTWIATLTVDGKIHSDDTIATGGTTGRTGSATFPTILPNASDGKTGIFSDTPSTISIAADGVEALRIEESAGEISARIGDGTADTTLSILGQNDSTAGATLRFMEDATSGNGIDLVYDSSSNNLILQDATNGRNVFGFFRDGKLAIGRQEASFTGSALQTGILNLRHDNDAVGYTIACIDENTGSIPFAVKNRTVQDKADVIVLGAIEVSEGVGMFGVSPPSQQAHVADANTSHATASYADVNTALDALATKINSILSLEETFGLRATS